MQKHRLLPYLDDITEYRIEADDMLRIQLAKPQKSGAKANKLNLLNNLGTLVHSLHVQGDEVVMALGKGLFQGLLHTVSADYGSHLQQSAEDNHVEDLAVLHLSSLVHCVNTVDGDVLARRRIDDTKAVVNEHATGLDFGFKLLERGLVEHYGNVVLREDG